MKLARNLTIAAVAIAALMAIGCSKEAPQSSSNAALDTPGQAIFFQQCAICHGRFGKGDTMIAANYPWANLADTQYGHGSSREEIIRNITEGVQQTPMRGFKGALTDQEIAQVADYVIALGKQ
jgi:mono/diheme cytochrome c family protein